MVQAVTRPVTPAPMTRMFGEEGTAAFRATGKGVRSLQKRRGPLIEVDILECAREKNCSLAVCEASQCGSLGRGPLNIQSSRLKCDLSRPATVNALPHENCYYEPHSVAALTTWYRVRYSVPANISRVMTCKPFSRTSDRKSSPNLTRSGRGSETHTS